MEGMNEAVRTGKARYIGIANAYAYQVAKMNAMAEQHGWAKFISVQNHYNLIMREEEREMFPFCHEENIAMTPYSALASGKLAKRPGETSKRQQEDSFMHFKYDATAEQDNRIVERVVDLADRYGVEMTQGRPLRDGDDTDFAGLAADKGGIADSRSHQTALYRGCREVA